MWHLYGLEFSFDSSVFSYTIKPDKHNSSQKDEKLQNVFDEIALNPVETGSLAHENFFVDEAMIRVTSKTEWFEN